MFVLCIALMCFTIFIYSAIALSLHHKALEENGDVSGDLLSFFQVSMVISLIAFLIVAVYIGFEIRGGRGAGGR